jgi:aerobic carbon-monoxide dehydrogenase small subunit
MSEQSLRVNGKLVRVEANGLRRLLDVLRDDLGLTGTKEGCGEGECGACTVLVDGKAVNSCLIPVCQVAGRDVRTIEGPGLDAICEGFLAEGGAQCGICTPGMIVATRAYFDRCKDTGTEVSEAGTREALAGNLCRCTGYGKIVASVLAASQEQA